jgi:hypothetical protein
MEFNADTIEEHIPYYLSQESKENLVKALREFPKTNYYTNLFPAETLQGDGWSALGLINYETGERKKVRGVILSNSCDIDLKNKRDIPVKLVFAPIIKLKTYARLLEEANIPKQNIEGKFKSIRDQKVSTIFYLPQCAGLDDEYIALLDDIHSIPLSAFTKEEGRIKLFTLSQVGFYLFLFKLSVHFCRFHEEVIRDQ